MISKVTADIDSPGAEEPNSVVNFAITKSVSSTGGSFLRRAGDENF